MFCQQIQGKHLTHTVLSDMDYSTQPQSTIIFQKLCPLVTLVWELYDLRTRCIVFYDSDDKLALIYVICYPLYKYAWQLVSFALCL